MKKSNYLTIQDLTVKVFTIALTILFARLLTKEEFGFYSQVFLIIGLFSALIGSALPMGLSYFYGQYKSYAGRQKLFKRFFLTFFLMSLILSIVFVLFNSQISSNFQNKWFEEFKWIIGGLIFFTIINGYFKNFTLLTNKLSKYVKVNFLAFVVMFTLQIVNIITIDSPLLIFVFLTFGQFLIFIFLSYDLKKYLKIKTKQKLVTMQEFKYILPLSAVGLIGVINEMIDQFMVSIMLDPIAMAELKVGSFQIPFISVITLSATTVLLPIFSKLISDNKTHEIAQLWKEVIQKTTILLLPIFIFCIFFAQDIIGLLFSLKYENAPLIFQIYTVKYFLTVITFGAVMGSIGLQNQWLYNLGIIVSVNLVLNYFAIKYFGIFGAAAVTSFVWYLGAYLQVSQINKKLKCKFFDYFPFKVYIKVLLISLSFAILLKLLLTYLVLSSFWILPISIIYYLVIIFIFDRKFTYIKQGIV